MPNYNRCCELRNHAKSALIVTLDVCGGLTEQRQRDKPLLSQHPFEYAHMYLCQWIKREFQNVQCRSNETQTGKSRSKCQCLMSHLYARSKLHSDMSKSPSERWIKNSNKVNVRCKVLRTIFTKSFSAMSKPFSNQYVLKLIFKNISRSTTFRHFCTAPKSNFSILNLRQSICRNLNKPCQHLPRLISFCQYLPRCWPTLPD